MSDQDTSGWDMQDSSARSRARRIGHASRALAFTAAVVTGFVATGVGVGHAAPGDSSFARSAFLSGSLLQLLDPLALARAAAANDGTAPLQTDRDGLDAEVVEAIGVEVTDGVPVPITLADVGVLGAFARAGSDGSSLAASGLVGDAGAIGVGAVAPSEAPGPLVVDLGDILGTEGALADLAALRLELDAVSASAQSVAGGAPIGDYEIAGGRLVARSEVLGELAGGITSRVGTLQTGVQARLDIAEATLLNAVLAEVTDAVGDLGVVSFTERSATITADLAGAVTLPTRLGEGTAIEIDLTTGTIIADLDRLGAGLNDRDPNTEVLSEETLAAISDGVLALVEELVQDVEDDLRLAVRSAAVSIDVSARVRLPLTAVSVPLLDIAIGASLGQLADPATADDLIDIDLLGGLPLLGFTGAVLAEVLSPLVTTVLADTTGLVSTTLGGIRTGLVAPIVNATGPALGLVDEIVSLRVNTQEPAVPTAGSAFTETAVRLTLLPSDLIGVTALTLDVAQAEVGPNSLAVLPELLDIDPATGPTSGGTPVTITGSALADVTEVTFDGVPGTGLVVADDGASLQVTSPPGTRGDAVVLVEAPSGISNPLTFTYTPVLAVFEIVPAAGPTAGGQLVRLTGTCLDAVTDVTFDGAAATLGDATETTLDLVTPPGAVGSADVVVTAAAPCAGTVTVTAGYEYEAVAPVVPMITGIAPEQDFETGGELVTVTGTGFAPGAVVTVDGAIVPAADVEVLSATQLTYLAPAHAPGVVEVTVTVEGVPSVSAPFTYLPVMAIDGVTPPVGSTAGGEVVTITGSCLTGVASVTFVSGDVRIPAASVTVLGDGAIQVVTPAGLPAGAVDIEVVASATCGGGTVTVPDAVTLLDPAPEAISLTPTEGPVAGGQTVTITGTGFDAVSSVEFGGVEVRDIVSVTPTEIVVVTEARPAALVDVIVTQPSGATTLLDAYTYLAPPAPVITGIAPDAGPVAGGQTVVITGTALDGATGVRFGGTTVPVGPDDVNDAGTELTVVTPPHALGTVDVRVIDPDGIGLLEDGYTYEPLPVPVVSSLAPDFGPIAGGQTVVLVGTHLDGATAVEFDGIPGELTVVTDTRIEVVTPPHAAGTVDVVLRHPGGNVERPDGYEYLPDPVAPAIESIDPAEGPVAGGIPVTISGPGVGATGSVDFGGADAGAVRVIDADTIRVTLPPHAEGEVTVTLVLPDGLELQTAFTYVGDAPVAPTVSSLSPASGPVAGGQLVTVSGTGLDAVDAVRFDGLAGEIVGTPTATTLQVRTPAHAAGPVDVVLEHDGAVVTVDDAYTYVAAPIEAPVAALLTPDEGGVAGGDTVVITGTGLDAVTEVRFGAVEATIVGTPSATQLTVLTPANPAGAVTVTLVHGPDDAEAPFADAFTYVDDTEPPTGTTVSPGAGPAAGGIPVTITGPGVGEATSVTFGGVDAGPITVVGPDQITVLLPGGAPGAVDVVIALPDGPRVLDDAFEYLAPDLPTITTITPDEGSTLGGETVVITGAHLDLVDAVFFGGATATIVGTPTAGSITVLTPAHAEGLVTVILRHDGVDESFASAYEYIAPAPVPPTVTAITPDEGSPLGGDEVTITGTKLDGVTAVTIDGVVVPFESTATTLTFETPAHEPGTVDIALSHPDGDVILENAFTFLPPPEIHDIEPAHGPVDGGNEVTLIGVHFTGSDTVTADGMPVDDFEVLSATRIRVVMPGGELGWAHIEVHHPHGNDVEFDGYLYREAIVPSVTSFTPDWAWVTGGAEVIISGTDLDAVTEVTFDGQPGLGLRYLGGNRLRVTAPPHAEGTVAMVVSTPEGSALAEAFRYMPLPDTAGPGTTPAGAGGTGALGTGGGSLAQTGATGGGTVLLLAFALLCAGGAAVLAGARRRLLQGA